MTPAEPRRLGPFAVLSVAAVGVAAFCMGFYVLPGPDPRATVWQRICRAAGIVPSLDRDSGDLALPGFTSVVITHAALVVGTSEQIGRGATLALRCTGCHGAQGLSGANAPNLAGQYSEVIYKQLIDFKRGARTDAVMNAMVASLTESNMLDLAHYYAYLPRPVGDRPLTDAPALVRVGAPMRNIAPCASCHGSQDGKVGAPSLEGEPMSYLRSQLTAFASGSRRNDANAVMRNEARNLSAGEIDSVTQHYAGTSP